MPDDANLLNRPVATPEPPPRRIRRVEAVVNPLSGSVGAGAAEQLEALLAAHGYGARVCEADPRDLSCAVRNAVDQAPDLVVILAGDGTAAMAARRAGPDGPLVAPLAGGTMNMLPHALYGPLGWKEALEATLNHGEERWVAGGEVDGQAFYVAAILGAPTLWARAREAMRKGRLDLALARARTALSRAFSGPLTYELDNGVQGAAEALTLLSPLVSRKMHGEAALEAAALDVRGAADAFRLGFNFLTGDWRDDPAVLVNLITGGEVRARGSIPAILDGEPRRLPSSVSIKFVPNAFRAFVPAKPPA